MTIMRLITIKKKYRLTALVYIPCKHLVSIEELNIVIVNSSELDVLK